MIQPLPLRLLISQEEIAQKITQICQQIDADYAGKEITLVMVMKGALCLAADLIRQLRLPCTLEFVQGSSYGFRGRERGDLEIFGLDRCHFAGKHILLVDDIFDSGNTLDSIAKHLQRKHPASLKSLVLLSKKVARHVHIQPDYVLFEIDNLFVVGYGLDYQEQYRGLPGIYFLTDEA